MLGNLIIGLGCGYIAMRLQSRFFLLQYLFDLQPRRLKGPSGQDRVA
jgi:hypothetical protein